MQKLNSTCTNAHIQYIRTYIRMHTVCIGVGNITMYRPSLEIVLQKRPPREGKGGQSHVSMCLSYIEDMPPKGP